MSFKLEWFSYKNLAHQLLLYTWSFGNILIKLFYSSLHRNTQTDESDDEHRSQSEASPTIDSMHSEI